MQIPASKSRYLIQKNFVKQANKYIKVQILLCARHGSKYPDNTRRS